MAKAALRSSSSTVTIPRIILASQDLATKARATTEPPTSYLPGLFDTATGQTWSKGYGAAGYSLFTNVTTLIPSATGYPVHYPASFSLTSQGDGFADMTRYLTQQASACPNKKFALRGNSHRGFVTIQTINDLPANVLSKVVAVAMFGSPACPAEVSGRCISYCQAVSPIPSLLVRAANSDRLV